MRSVDGGLGVSFAALALASVVAGCAPDDRCPGPLVCRLVEPAGPRVRMVAYGTSLTADRGWVLAVGDALERDYPGTTEIINAAEGARYSVWALENLDARVLSQLPDLVFLEFAVNDAYTPYAIDIATSVGNLETLIDRILTSRPDADVVIIVSNHVIGDGAIARPRLSDYYAAWREVGAREGLVVVDEEPVWALLLARAPDVFLVLAPDGLHPTYAGHALMNAPLILDALEGRTSDPEAVVAAAILAAAAM